MLNQKHWKVDTDTFLEGTKRNLAGSLGILSSTLHVNSCSEVCLTGLDLGLFWVQAKSVRYWLFEELVYERELLQMMCGPVQTGLECKFKHSRMFLFK